MYVQILNPLDGKTSLSPTEADRLVYRGAASFVVDDQGVRWLRYLAGYEAMRIRSEMDRAWELAVYDRDVNVGRGGKIQGEWHPRRSGSGMIGGPEGRATQFEMTLESVVIDRKTIRIQRANLRVVTRLE